MAEIIQEEKGKKGGKRRPKKHSTHIDMTPMVDLMCLLITFFMLTTAFAKPKVMDIILPEKTTDNKDRTQVSESRTFNIILADNDKIYWYPGAMKKPPYPPLQLTDFSANGIRKLLAERNRTLFKKIEQFNKDVLFGKIDKSAADSLLRKLKKEDDTGPVVLIKADPKAKYKNLVDIIDEMAIVSIARYAIVDINYVEQSMVDKERANAAPVATAPAK